MDLTTAILVLAGAFLLGSIPTGYLAGRARGVDLRQHGSGNIGATNAMRILGKPLGVFVFLIDALKGAAAVWLAVRLTPASAGAWPGILAAVGAIAGHNFTPWLGFKGGKGIATSTGALLALMPLAVLAIAGVWFLLFRLTRYVSVASMSAAAALPVVIALLWHFDLGGNGPLFGFAVVISVLAIWRHRSNIARLRAGTESRSGQPTNP